MKKFWNGINWLKGAGIVTAGYLGIFLYWIGYDRIVRYPTNNSLNEVGDFIAGFFSPLAFIWLVAAVLTQRQELTDTRDQLAENQKVVDAQLKTINEQSELLQQQHTLAEDTAKKMYRLSLFDQRFAIYNELVAIHFKMDQYGLTDKSYSDIKAIRTKASFVFGEQIEEFLEYIERELDEYFIRRTAYNEALETEKYVIGGHRSGDQRAADEIEESSRDTIISMLEPDALRSVMWNDMGVSDS